MHARSAVLSLAIPQQALILPVIAFAIPFFISGPQWLTGTAVNCLLILAAARLPKRFLWPVMILPSLGAVAHGALFGPFTAFLIPFVPFIWAGNGLFALTFIRLRPASAAGAVCIGALLKAAFLASCALAFVRLGLVPALFVQSMSLIQLFTALAGGMLALMILRFLKHTHE